MPREGDTGCFHLDRSIDNRTDVLRNWRVTTDSRNVAQVVARNLGGDVRMIEDPGCCDWEVLTQSSTVEVLVSEVADGGITFFLLGESDVGSFFFSSAMWNPEEIFRLSTAMEYYSARCILRLKPVEFETRTGLTVLYILPSIELVASGP